MEASAERINSASWREKFHHTSNSYPTNGRSEHRIVGFGAEILHKPSRYYDTSPGDDANQNGRTEGIIFFMLQNFRYVLLECL